MKFVLFAFALLVAGCATHSKSTIAAVRAAGVEEGTVRKLEHHGVLLPNDLIELKKRGVSDAVPLRQLDEVGVDYLVQRDDLRKLRSAGVARVVSDALIDASDRFWRERRAQAYYYGYGEPYPGYYGGPWWWPEVTLGYAWGWGHGGHSGHDGGHHGGHGHWR